MRPFAKIYVTDVQRPNLYILNKDGDTAYMALEKKLRIRMFGTKPDPKEKPLTEAQKKALTECYDAIVAFGTAKRVYRTSLTSAQRTVCSLPLQAETQVRCGRSL